MAFKMKANPEGPMRKNFPSVFKKKGDKDKIDLSGKSEKELAEIAKRNIEAAKKKADNSIYVDNSTTDKEKKPLYQEYINNASYGGLASDSIQAVRQELKIRKK